MDGGCDSGSRRRTRAPAALGGTAATRRGGSAPLFGGNECLAGGSKDSFSLCGCAGGDSASGCDDLAPAPLNIQLPEVCGRKLGPGPYRTSALEAAAAAAAAACCSFCRLGNSCPKSGDCWCRNDDFGLASPHVLPESSLSFGSAAVDGGAAGAGGGAAAAAAAFASWVSDLRLGKLAGALLAVGILPKLCRPCFWGAERLEGLAAEPYRRWKNISELELKTKECFLT